ncbi:MAG: TonB-dependent receptor, partial [Pseudomonadota bacterium]
GSLSGTIGVYLWESEYEIRLRSFIGFAVPDTILDLPQTSAQETDSQSIFFEGDYAINDAWVFTLGGRYTRDEKDTNQAGVVTAIADDDWTEFTPKVGIRYQATEDAMLYATYSVGYRSGGFNGRVDSVETATTPYDQETVDNIEVGFKTEWLDRRLRFNGAIFSMDYDDKQEELQLPSATSGTGQVTLVANASTATLRGIELDVLYYPIENFSIRANLGLLDAEYDDFQFTGASGDQVDLSNLELRRAPDVTASISGSYEWNIGAGRAWIFAGINYLDEYQVDFANKPELTNDAQTLINASLNYAWGNLQVSLYGHNLTEEEGYGIGFDVAGLWSYAATRAPRTYALEVSYTFE